MVQNSLSVTWCLLCLLRSRYDWHRPPQNSFPLVIQWPQDFSDSLGDTHSIALAASDSCFHTYYLHLTAHGPRREAQPLLIFHRITCWYKEFVGEADLFEDTRWSGGENEGRTYIMAMQTSSSWTLRVSILKIPFWPPHHQILLSCFLLQLTYSFASSSAP